MIKVEIEVNSPVIKVWDYFTKAEHVTQWNFAHESWHCPFAENNLEVGGNFRYRMEAKDGSSGFDFSGTYDEVIIYRVIAYHLAERKVHVTFSEHENTTTVTEEFDPDEVYSREQQQSGWQAILNNFKDYTESH